MNAIDEAVAAAEAQAANVPAQAAPSTGGALAPSGGGAVDMSIAGFLKAGGISPDNWLDIRDTGFRLNKQEKAVFEEFRGTIDFANVKMFQGLRVALPGDKYEYLKTYDGRSESKTGQPWNNAVADANNRAIKPSNPYRGADILIELTEDVKQGKSSFPAGTKVGYTTSITAYNAFKAFFGQLIQNGDIQVNPDGETLSGVVDVVVRHESQSNANYEWSIAVFEKAE